MLDTETKRRIDTARDILVGKVPDPKSQVEQITIALIYKFMDDMDAEAEELGGQRTFFSGEFAPYSWAKLLAPGLGGHETLALYGEGMVSMNRNTGLPPLFRDIFKNAYLPYRDPETLKSFLKVINGFVYDHSERLGDAFEYLLSVLGSQGDAGQFRTPRHIIDFMVEVLDPQKNESILDPACGTAGFLISAYKYIIRNNQSKMNDEENLNSSFSIHNSSLTSDERARLLSNIKGYDISPDMVRLSLVNLYLHGFSNPQIAEYDTLTSEERWLEYADIILANPPFMSPKGGIKPHGRFSVKSSRSEVLFVDYMAEHLTPTGRAAIIVPEGIIFQSQNSYKQLRKILVDDYLVGIISLPAGVFQPYSGVKTSILWLDRTLAKKSNQILFVKIDQDGFGLGAQRREIKQNDLPTALAGIKNYKLKMMNGEDFAAGDYPNLTVATKAEIAANGYNLSGERYRNVELKITNYELVALGEVAEIIAGQSPLGEFYNDIGEGMPFYQGKTEFGNMFIGAPKKWTTQITKIAVSGDILMSVRAPVGPVNFATKEICIGRGLAAIRAKPNILANYLFYFLRSQEGNIKGSGGAVFDSISRQQIEELQIPLPPLEVQAEIVAEIEGYQGIIDGARQVLAAYRPRIAIDPSWPKYNLNDVTVFQEGPGILAKDFRSEGIPLIRLAGLRTGKVSLAGCNYLDPIMVEQKWSQFKLSEGDILILTSASFGNPAIVESDTVGAIFYTGIIRFKPKSSELDAGYLRIYLGSASFLDQAESLASGSVIRHFGPSHLKQMFIPLPDLATQAAIVSQIEREQALVNANRELIEIFEGKIKAKIKAIMN